MLVVVDKIGLQTSHDISGGLTVRGGGISSVVYEKWNRYPYLAAHEFFHQLTLTDLSGKDSTKNIMFEMGGSTRTELNNDQRLRMNTFLMDQIDKMYSSKQYNPGFNTVLNLRTFLNNSTNGITYNKAKFR